MSQPTKLSDVFKPGDRVVYITDGGGPREEGVVTSTSDCYVFVCYGLPGSTSKATRASQLEKITQVRYEPRG